MRKKNWYVILVCLIPLLGMMSCSDDEDVFGIDEITQEAFSSGIDVPADGNLVVLRFDKADKEWRTELQFHSDDQNWCSAELRPDAQTCSIKTCNNSKHRCRRPQSNAPSDFGKCDPRSSYNPGRGKTHCAAPQGLLHAT